MNNIYKAPHSAVVEEKKYAVFSYLKMASILVFHLLLEMSLIWIMFTYFHNVISFDENLAAGISRDTEYSFLLNNLILASIAALLSGLITCALMFFLLKSMQLKYALSVGGISMVIMYLFPAPFFGLRMFLLAANILLLLLMVIAAYLMQKHGAGKS